MVWVCQYWVLWTFLYYILLKRIQGCNTSIRVEEFTSDWLKLKEFNDALQIDQAMYIEESEKFKKVAFSLHPPHLHFPLTLFSSLSPFLISSFVQFRSHSTVS